MKNLVAMLVVTLLVTVANIASSEEEKKKHQGVLKVPKGIPGWTSGNINDLDDIEYEIVTGGSSSKNGGTDPDPGKPDTGPPGGGGDAGGGQPPDGGSTGDKGDGNQDDNGSDKGKPEDGPTDAKPKPMPINDPAMGKTPGVYEDGDLIYVVLEDSKRLTPLVRDREELFSDTVDRRKSDYDVIVNGNIYDVTALGKVDAAWGNDPIAPSETLPEGRVIVNGRRVTGGSEPERFYIASRDEGEQVQYEFGFGDPPKDVDYAVGGLGPMIIDGLKYGDGNQYRAGVPAGAPSTGKPDAKYVPFLTQRNNNTYIAFGPGNRPVGKTIIAHDRQANRLVVISQPHNAARGQSLDEIRDALFQQGFENAVFLDGSDSALLVADGVKYVTQGPNKDETNIVGIGFGTLGRASSRAEPAQQWQHILQVLTDYYERNKQNSHSVVLAHQLLQIATRSHDNRSEAGGWAGDFVRSTFVYIADSIQADPSYWDEPTGTEKHRATDHGSRWDVLWSATIAGEHHFKQHLEPAFEQFVEMRFREALAASPDNRVEGIGKEIDSITQEHKLFIAQAVLPGFKAVDELFEYARGLAGWEIEARATNLRKSTFDKVLLRLTREGKLTGWERLNLLSRAGLNVMPRGF